MYTFLPGPHHVPDSPKIVLDHVHVCVCVCVCVCPLLQPIVVCGYQEQWMKLTNHQCNVFN